VALPPAAHAQTVTVNVDTTTPIRPVDEKVFGVNTAVWNQAFPDPQTVLDLQDMQVRMLRYPGGSSSDDYNWQTNQSQVEMQSAGATNFDTFAASALAIGAQVVITTNYGTGTPQEAAAWVTYSNVTKGYGFKYWEVGNECYGTWEDDIQAKPHDPVTYATRAVQYIQAMKAADPTIKIGVVADASEDSYQNGNLVVATNLVNGTKHIGWTPVMLSTMAGLGVLPDFLIYHSYAQNPGSENDSLLLQESALTWPAAATGLRNQLTDYVGAAGAGIQLLVTENNSVNTNPGKQSVSLVNGLFMADSVGTLMQTEFNSLIWWDMYNGQGNTSVNLSPSLYGWRQYGDYGVENGEGGSLDPISHDRYPTYYVMKLLSKFARQGDTVVTASSNSTLLSTYAVHRLDDSLTLLVINKSPTATFNANFAIKGYTPQANATAYSYGIPQDEYSEENAQSVNTSSVNSSWENQMDGWVNQSGSDVAASNYGLDAPFAYTVGFSTTTGVTNGSYSLACTTTQTGLADHAVIQNSTAAMGTALSTASSVSFDVYPVASGGTVAASIYINGINILYAELTPVNLNLNQENTVTFTLTAAQRAGILASLGSGNWFQVGIDINSTNAVTVYLDNFQVQSAVAPTPTPTPTPIVGAATSPDIAVSSLSNAGASFTASFAPYSVNVISLTKPSLAPAFVSQPSSQTIASGGTVVFSAPATGTPLPTYQWYLNGTAIASATNPTLLVSGATAADAGSYTCTISNPSGTLKSSAAVLGVVNASSPGRLINIATRAQVETGGNILIPGFVIGGSGTETLLIRADGPALTAFGVSGALAAPSLVLTNQSTGATLATNTGWGTNTNPTPAQIASVAAQVGAFALANGSADCAAIVTLQPGAYTVQVSGVGGTTGVALAEVYEVSYTGTARLVNIATRAQVGTGGNILIPGFVIGGSTAETVLIRADGPSLTAFGVSGALAAPSLILTAQSTGVTLAANTSWGTNPNPAQIASVAGQVGAFAVSSGSADSAVLVTLPPGAYTVQTSGVGSTTGVALAEIYEVR
jgi:hypothetical protein